MVHISTDIDIFIEKMLILLPQDIVLYIVKKYIYLPKNKLVIYNQKQFYKQLLIQLVFVSNIIFVDRNCCIYIDNNNIVISNNCDNVQLYGTSNYITNITDNFTYDIYTSNINDYDIPYSISSNNNSNLLNEINNNLNYISQYIDMYDLENTCNILYSSIYNTSNIVLNTSHQDMDDITFYILYT